MNNLLSIDGDKIVIEKLRVKFTEGPITHAGSLDVVGQTKLNDNISVKGNATVTGTITADTINVKHIICDEPGGVNDPFAFTANTAKELDGRGFQFTDGNATRQFVFKEGDKMWSTMDLDLARGKSYKIENIPVLSINRLGDSIVQSNLQSVGDLHKLKVTGSVEFAQWAYFNPVHNRFGINTESPNGAIGIAENNVELILGSFKNDFGYIGTYTNSGLEIGTDNTSRIVISNTGEINIGHSKYKNAVVRIHGRLEVDEIVNDPRNSQGLPLTFTSAKDRSVYGTGIMWQQDGAIHQFTLAANPERIYSSDIIDLEKDRWYSIDNSMVISKTGLGNTVTNSSLTSVGVLAQLDVDGDVRLKSSLQVGPNSDVTISDRIAIAGSNQVKISNEGFSVREKFLVVCDNEEEFKITSSGNIEIGNKQNTNRKISVYGQFAVGASNPDSDVAFTVAGAVSLNNKKFVNGTAIPTAGRFNKGDVCWNIDPKATDYVGWVCVREGTPGEWLPFGRIESQ